MGSNKLKELYLFPITGLYDECHHIDYASLNSTNELIAEGKYSLKPINNLWWHTILSRETLELIVDRLQNYYRYISAE